MTAFLLNIVRECHLKERQNFIAEDMRIEILNEAFRLQCGAYIFRPWLHSSTSSESKIWGNYARQYLHG